MTVYDASTRALIANKQQIADKSSRMDLDKNKDGSVDIHVGPDKPESRTANWIPTVPGKAWFAYFRFYSPTEPYFDRRWVLPDVAKVSGRIHSLRRGRRRRIRRRSRRTIATERRKAN